MEKKNTNNVQEYFEAMVKDITINKISLQQFFEYYNNLKNAVASQLVKEPLNYLLALKFLIKIYVFASGFGVYLLKSSH